MTQGTIAPITHIELEDTPSGQRAQIAGGGIRVAAIVVLYVHWGLSVAWISESLRLPFAHIHAALAYYYDHQAELDVEIEAGKRPPYQPNNDSPE
jgi:uncharacterized protein (DUF433 family)